MKRLNIMIDPTTYEDFIIYAERKGIKLSTYVNAKLKEFVEEEKKVEELRKQK
jgi:predicted HicB family RNase H-like nuclease